MVKQATKPQFYTFQQNNSGGSFVEDPERGLAHFVIIEAKSEHQATAKAEDIGVYFNGVEAEMDCECCGDRWSGADTPTPLPQVYQEEVKPYCPHPKYLPQDLSKPFHSIKWMKAAEGYIHYEDGSIKPFYVEELEAKRHGFLW